MSLRDLDSTYVKIDLDAMLDNLSAISEKAGTMVLAVIKADAYGHGAVEVAKALESHCAFFGVSSILEALELLRHKEIPCGLTAMFSTREETGGEGAAAAAAAIAPTEALEMDVSFGKTPDTDDIETKFMKKGPMIGFAPGLDRKMSERLVALAQKHEIPWQYEVMNGTTGTNADDMAKAGAGVRCCTISPPQQYMHTVIEKMAVEDIRNIGRLIAAYVLEGGEE